MKAAIVVGTFVTAWLVPAGARAEPHEFSVGYEAPASCPARQAFVEAVRARLPSAVERPAGEARLEFEVTIAAQGALSSGTLVIRDRAREFRRVIPPAECRELLASMAVIAAMVLEAAGLESAGSESEAPAPDETPEVPEDAASKPPARVKPTSNERPRKGTGEQRVPSASKAGSKREEPVKFAAVFGLGFQTGVAPSLVPSVSAGLDGVFGDTASAPSARLRGAYAWSGTTETRFGDARFRLWSLEAQGCGPRLPAGTAGVRPCALVEAGSLSGSGSNTLEGNSRSMPWLGLGAALRLELELPRTFGLELEAKGVRLVRSDRFVFDPDLVAHQVPEWAFGVRVGPVFRFF